MSPGSWHGLGRMTWGGGHPSLLHPRHQHCGAAFALSLSIADIYLIIEQGPPAWNHVPAGSHCPCHIQPRCRTPWGLRTAGGGGQWEGGGRGCAAGPPHDLTGGSPARPRAGAEAGFGPTSAARWGLGGVPLAAPASCRRAAQALTSSLALPGCGAACELWAWPPAWARAPARAWVGSAEAAQLTPGTGLPGVGLTWRGPYPSLALFLRCSLSLFSISLLFFFYFTFLFFSFSLFFLSSLPSFSSLLSFLPFFLFYASFFLFLFFPLLSLLSHPGSVLPGGPTTSLPAPSPDGAGLAEPVVAS